MSATAIIAKDLLLLRRDRRALATLVVMPLIFITILGLSTGRLMGWRAANATLRIVFVNEGGGELSVELIRAVSARAGIDSETAADESLAREQVRNGDRTVAVVIGGDFPNRADRLELSDVLDPRRGRLAGGLPGLDVRLYARTSNDISRGIVDRMVWAEAVQLLLPYVARKDPMVRAVWAGRDSGRDVPIRDSSSAAAGADPAVPDPDGNADSRSQMSEQDPSPASAQAPSPMHNRVYQVLVPAYTVMFMFFLINIMARSFIAEREHGTLCRLRAAPVGHGALLVAKTVPFLIVSIVQGALLFVCGRMLFGMSWGSHPWMLVPVTLCTCVAATTLGLLVATLVRSEAQVSAYATLLVITLAGISGCMMPRDWLPDLMRQMSLITPHAWSLIAYDELLSEADAGPGRVWRSCLMLLVFSAGFFAAGWWRFRKAQQAN